MEPYWDFWLKFKKGKLGGGVDGEVNMLMI